MLKNIPKIISPNLLKILDEMGHGDELVIADGNFPGNSISQNVVRADGHGVSEVLDAILKLLPLDTYADYNVGLMEVCKGDDVVPVIWDTYKQILKENVSEKVIIKNFERFEFYEQAKKSYCVISTSEGALYGNVILKKGVIK